MARQSRSNCQLGWVIYAETFLAVVAFTYISMLCVDAPEEDSKLPSLSTSFPSAHVAKLHDYDGAVGLADPLDGVGTPIPLVVREAPEKLEKPEQKPRCESKLPAFTTTFVIAFMAGGFMNVERIQGLPIP